MTIKDIIRHELIGLTIEITESKNNSLIGLKGKIIDETKNTLTLETKKGIKKIIKSQIKFKIKNNDQMIEIDGKLIVNRPEDRIKRIRKI
ncbi:MAG: ribonuclease P protein subunit [Candidatus Nanoarchaeia archaeon]|jgi:ribonuclease P protein subunit POP4|nr:ribonuclease P protein subunit [Candidatus Nanoarchaeia archaeon]|tara:strand:- start:16049 stop:16318 length:270 start_codon:yes stop_codon:yes gene_type:complete